MLPAYTPSRGIRRIPYLQNLLPEYRIQTSRNHAEAVIGWGMRPTTAKARAFAEANHLSFITLEDGFLRSLGLGVTGWPPLSVVYDDIGIYYDTARPSRLENLILSASNMPQSLLDDARRAMALIEANKLSKYNHAPEWDAQNMPSEKPTVLLIDQTFGDMAVKCGGADEATFERMFQTALAENPDAKIVVKTHPDVLCGKKKGYLTDLAQQGNVCLLAEDVNPISLLQTADKVYCVTSQMGFEALMIGKPVTVFGLPWYAGWGLTDDRHEGVQTLLAQNRRATRSLAQLFAAAYLQYSRYLNPANGEAGSIFDVIDCLAAGRRLNDKLRGDVYCAGMSLWKRAVMKPFFNVPSCRLKFAKSVAALEHIEYSDNARILVWGSGKDALLLLAQRKNLPVLRMEDGFIRSVGLGSNLVPPLSLVMDTRGIYFNPQMPSDLENVLQNQTFSAHDIQTASQLQTVLTEKNISKYNVGSTDFAKPQTDKRILLVPGQVEDDASVRHGSPAVFKNLDLLRTVRERNPDAFIIYKPHPDVVSGNRVGHILPEETGRLADAVAAETDILTCLQYADEVHTMTSLTGFEALLRGKKVFCYGLPFYAGWGLTEDLLPIARRTRRLKLEELIAGTLIYYPNYIHPETRQLMNAAGAAAWLGQQKSLQKNNNQLHRNWLSKQAGKIKQLYRSLK